MIMQDLVLINFFDYKKNFDSENKKDKLLEKRVVGNMINITFVLYKKYIYKNFSFNL